MGRSSSALLALLLLAVLLPTVSEAYPWMIRHGYTGCVTCHDDPSGGSLLTQYGRAQSEILLATRYGGAPAKPAGDQKAAGAEEAEASPQAQFLFGAVPLPDWLNLALAFRAGGMSIRPGGGVRVDTFPLMMVADVRAGLRFGPFRASGAIGYAPNLAEPARVTGDLVSREHWVGLSFADDALLVRAGRLNLPFGLRNVEHTFWVRDLTDTDINADQQHGLAVSYSGESVRGELMAIAGNYQLRPDNYRERGYAAFAEWAFAERAAVGASSLVTHAQDDPVTLAPNLWRMSHGLFARWAPVRPLVLLAEADVVRRSTDLEDGTFEPVGLLQVDLEPWQGLHLLGEGELRRAGGATGLGGWLGVEWFFNPHASVRVDTLVRREPGGDAVTTLLGQLHVNL